MSEGIGTIIKDISQYYKKEKKYTKSKLAEMIGTTEKSLYNWENDKTIIDEYNINAILSFLRKMRKEEDDKNANLFINRLKEAYYIKPIELEKLDTLEDLHYDIDNDIWIPGFAEKDKQILRDYFFTKNELLFMLKLVETDGDTEKAAKFIFPNDDNISLVDRAKLITSWNKKLKDLSGLIGIKGVLEWQKYIIPYIEKPMECDGDLESLGRQVLWNICVFYLEEGNKKISAIKAELLKKPSYDESDFMFINSIWELYNMLPLKNDKTSFSISEITPMGRLWNNLVQDNTLTETGEDFGIFIEAYGKEYEIYRKDYDMALFDSLYKL